MAGAPQHSKLKGRNGTFAFGNLLIRFNAGFLILASAGGLATDIAGSFGRGAAGRAIPLDFINRRENMPAKSVKKIGAVATAAAIGFAAVEIIGVTVPALSLVSQAEARVGQAQPAALGQA
ncbi:hypothetical protein [Mesorhizobium sp.]|uniref:hypothetical protein n=1 Tax=Mesorhizobium sp. TaxID=1871066 RepID=UPI000FE8D8A6|nr:hypothetical protein [Mesorhizobium sp.]RWK50109.1 MAG: hypothetical protein EOR48_27970 [Mesorhizobium sp.]TIP41172.1 MAG: hypothetical protein E5X62_26100 [Mesorhizobium sp.]